MSDPVQSFEDWKRSESWLFNHIDQNALVGAAYAAWCARDPEVAKLTELADFWCGENDASQAQVAALTEETIRLREQLAKDDDVMGNEIGASTK